MSNHFHVILRNRPDVVSGWSDEELAQRWWKLCPTRKEKDGSAKKPTEFELNMIQADKKQLSEKRARLSSISWFMRFLCEKVAREANKQDECTGRFWQGRFKAQVLLDEAALLACMQYVDLNPIRAKLAASPEKSGFTSGQDRVLDFRDAEGGSEAPSSGLRPPSPPRGRRDGDCQLDGDETLTRPEALRPEALRPEALRPEALRPYGLTAFGSRRGRWWLVRTADPTGSG